MSSASTTDGNASDAVLLQLAQTLAERKQSGDPVSSYVAQLHHKGLNKILEKVGEESTEVILAARDLEAARSSEQASAALVNETADLWFHTMVMLSHCDIEVSAVLSELASRFDLSGLKEKAQRGH